MYNKMCLLISWTICLWAVLASAELLKLDFTRAPAGSTGLSRRGLELHIGNDLLHQVSVSSLGHLVAPREPTCCVALCRQSNGWDTATTIFHYS